MMDGFDIAELCRFSNNFKLELKNPPDFVYHYTSKEAAKNIIKGNTLRFTDRYFKRNWMKELRMAKRIRFLYISVP